MAMDMFLKIAGVPGESRDAAHAGEIDVVSWSWGLSNPGSAHAGGGGGSGKVKVQDLFVVVYQNKASPVLLLHCCSGKHLPEAVLTVRKAGEKPLEYLVVTMKDVLITSALTGSATSGPDLPTEGYGLNFARFEVQYVEQTATGGAGARPKMAWDIAGNVKV